MPLIPPLASTRPPPRFAPVITPPALPSSEPSQVLVHLTTTLVISDFPSFYPGASPDTFCPAYHALADGSLVAPPLHDDLVLNNAFLIITSFFLSVFLRNVSKTATYLWKGKIKKKGLLYTLFVSQLLGPIAFILVVVSQFTRSTDCTVILRIFFIASGVSLSLLVTGIFGVKAYRCLDNNRLVSIVLVLLRTAGSAVLILDVIHIHTLRSLSGRCRRPSTGLASIFVILLLAESSFICACFFYAMRRSHGPVAVRGRISVQLSLDDDIHSQPTELREQSTDSVRHRRGWSNPRPYTNHLSATWQTFPLSRDPSIASTPHDGLQGVHDYTALGSTEIAQSSNRPIPFPSTVHSRPPAPRSWTVKVPTTAGDSESVAAPSAHSPICRFTRYIPRMSLFREVMRDELCYTAITTACTVVSAAMILVGAKNAGGIGGIIWIAFNWVVISLLVVHSFGRAVRRHEDELLLLHPSAMYHDFHTDRTTAELLGDISQPTRTPGTLSRARARCSVARYDLDGGTLPSELSTRRLFPRSADFLRGDLHSLAASTSGTSNVFPSMETELLSRTQVSSTIYVEDGLSCFPKLPEEWFDKNLSSASSPPETPDEGRSCDTSVHVS